MRSPRSGQTRHPSWRTSSSGPRLARATRSRSQSDSGHGPPRTARPVTDRSPRRVRTSMPAVGLGGAGVSQGKDQRRTAVLLVAEQSGPAGSPGPTRRAHHHRRAHTSVSPGRRDKRLRDSVPGRLRRLPLRSEIAAYFRTATARCRARGRRARDARRGIRAGLAPDPSAAPRATVPLPDHT
jgi:hypothetical protein